MKIIFPEITTNQAARSASSAFPDIEWLTAPNLEAATKMLANGEADSIISGIDFPSRDVLLACKAEIPLASPFFSSCFICQKDNSHLTIADGGVNKQPSTEQLYTIVEDTAKTHEAYFKTQPKIAMLSYSTKDSGGKNPDLYKITTVINQIRKNHPDWQIDGEMQLDAAIVPDIGKKKVPSSPVAGYANILITPDLNSGNILYKSMEHLGRWTMAGPILQGFSIPLADLSRGSSVQDIILTIDVIKKLYERKS